MSFDPEGPVGKQVKPILVNELINRFNIPDEAEDVAEYMLVLIGGNKVPSEIVSEVKELSDIPIDESFVQSLFVEIKKAMEQQSQASAAPVAQPPVNNTPPQPAQVQPPVQPASAQVPIQAPTSAFANTSNVTFNSADTSMNNDDDMQEDRVDFSMPSRPRGNALKRGGGRGGIGKASAGRGGKKSFATQNASNFERMMGMQDVNIIDNTKFVNKPPKGRCRNFPGCNNKDCRFSHPTKVCNAYPNCTNPPGTCNFLHPDQDQELMAKLEVSKQEYLDRKNQRRNNHGQGGYNNFHPFPPQPIETGIAICKFGVLCSKDLCPFGHPTPANVEAKVIDLVWCEDGKNCKNNSCRKAHPSPGYLAPPPPEKPSGGYNAMGKPRFEPSLEQCKFGLGCTKANCPKRHATSTVPCKNGAECQRIDCTFVHPINEVCKFGVNCTNKGCMFQHPEGKNLGNNSNVWVKENTDQRSFAVPEDQVMEKAEQPSMVN